MNGEGIRRADPSEPFAALAFKVVTDRYAGRLVFVRVYSGTVKVGETILNSSTGKKIRLTKIFRMHADKRTPLDATAAGDIVAVVSSSPINTGDTLCDPKAPILLEKIQFPEPVVFVAVEPRTEAEQDALEDGLRKLAAEDPTFRVSVDETTNQTIIAGMGNSTLRS